MRFSFETCSAVLFPAPRALLARTGFLRRSSSIPQHSPFQHSPLGRRVSLRSPPSRKFRHESRQHCRYDWVRWWKGLYRNSGGPDLRGQRGQSMGTLRAQNQGRGNVHYQTAIITQLKKQKKPDFNSQALKLRTNAPLKIYLSSKSEYLSQIIFGLRFWFCPNNKCVMAPSLQVGFYKW